MFRNEVGDVVLHRSVSTSIKLIDQLLIHNMELAT